MQDYKLCSCHTATGNCSKDAHTGKGGKIVGMTRCRLHDKTAKNCPYYIESDYLREYYTKHPSWD
nr:MAG TPA: hypothetical protein [Caudoviricetes sp.]